MPRPKIVKKPVAGVAPKRRLTLFERVARGLVINPASRQLKLIRTIGGKGKGAIRAPAPSTHQIDQRRREEILREQERKFWGNKPHPLVKKLAKLDRKMPDAQHHSGPHHTPFVRHPVKQNPPARNSRDK